MSFERPTLKEIIDRLDGETQSRLSVPQLRRSNAKVFDRVLAGAAHSLYGYISYLNRQQFFDTAESEYLDRWASIYGLLRKKATRGASGAVTFSFSAGLVNVPVGTILQSDDGVQYQTTGAVDSDGKAAVEALNDGVIGNQQDGDVLTLVSPIIGVFSEVEIIKLGGGSEAESASFKQSSRDAVRRYIFGLRSMGARSSGRHQSLVLSSGKRGRDGHGPFCL